MPRNPTDTGVPLPRVLLQALCKDIRLAPALLLSWNMQKPGKLTAHVTRLNLVKIAFVSDDPGLRKRLFDAIFSEKCPDFECSLGSPCGTGSYTAMWRPEHAGAVCTWARSIGIDVFSTSGGASDPSMSHIQLPDIGDIAPGGVVDPCITDAERMLADQGLEPTACNWLSVCDHFLSLPIISTAHTVAFRLLRCAIERAALGAVKIDPRPVPREILE